MLYRYVFIPHLLCLVFRVDEGLVQVLAYKRLPALYFCALAESLFDTVDEYRFF